MFYDTGVTGTPQTDYIISDNRMSKQVTDDGTVISYETGNYAHLFIKANTPTFQAPFKIEFDLVSYNGGNYFNLMDSDGEARIKLSLTGHYVITVPLNQNITATCDGNPVTVNPNNLIPNLARLSFFIVGAGSTITFKELKIYPI